MATLHIENTVRDYASWQEAFDKFERFRAENGVCTFQRMPAFTVKSGRHRHESWIWTPTSHNRPSCMLSPRML